MSDESIAGVQFEAGFERLTIRYRSRLHAHCRRLLGSHDDAEDAGQETYLRAWRWRRTRRSETSTRAWLYRIATNVCLDALSHRRRHNLAQISGPAGEAGGHPLDEVVGGPEPDVEVASKETLELTYIAAIRHLSPRQHTVLILREVLGHSARETAKLMDASVASVNSAGQRARRTLRRQLPEQRLEWYPDGASSERERRLVERYLEATERGDAEAVVLATAVADGLSAGRPPRPAPRRARSGPRPRACGTRSRGASRPSSG
jgi:RNA polymerase sigma-70 factor, ECF subfamily